MPVFQKSEIWLTPSHYFDFQLQKCSQTDGFWAYQISFSLPFFYKKKKEENQNAWSKVKCDSLLFKKDDVFITLTFASVHLNSHVPLSVPLFGPKPNKACSDVLLQIVLCDCVGAEATLEHLQWQKLSHITSINSGINHWFSPDHTSLRPRSNVERFMRRTKL